MADRQKLVPESQSRLHNYREALRKSPVLGFPVIELDAAKGDRILAVTREETGIRYRYACDGVEHEEFIPDTKQTPRSITTDAAIIQMANGTEAPKLVFIGGRSQRVREKGSNRTLDRRIYRYVDGMEGISPAAQLTLYLNPPEYRKNGTLVLVQENIGAAHVIHHNQSRAGHEPLRLPHLRTLAQDGPDAFGSAPDFMKPKEAGLYTPLPFPAAAGITARTELFGYQRPLPCLTLQASA